MISGAASLDDWERRIIGHHRARCQSPESFLLTEELRQRTRKSDKQI
jgi:hypothetical protein